MIKSIINRIFRQQEVINIPNKDYRIALLKMERAIRNSPTGFLTKDGFKTEHSFADGLYIRKTYVPKGFIFITYIHKKSHPAVHVGDATIIEPNGNKRVRGVVQWVTPAGTQRIIFTHEDSYCITTHLNPKNLRDIDKIEKMLYAEHYNEFFNHDKEMDEELSFLNKEELCLA